MRNKIFTSIHRQIHSLSMKNKLIISFSLPVVILLVVFMVVYFNISAKDTKNQFIESSEKAYDQAYSLIDNYIKDMIYVSDVVYYNGDIQRILSNDRFTGDRDVPEQFREYLVLDSVMNFSEKSDVVYQTKLYVPDEMMYSNNRLHFMPNSDLKQKYYYKSMKSWLAVNKNYFSTAEPWAGPNDKMNTDIISLYRNIDSIDGNNTHLGVQQVTVKLSLINEAMVNSNITKSGLVYIVNSRKELVTSTNNDYFQKLLDFNSDFLLEYEYSQYSEYTTIGDKVFFCKSSTINNSQWMIVALIPESEMNESATKMGINLAIFTLMIIVLIICISIIMANYYTKRISILNNSIQKVRSGDLSVKLDITGDDEISFLYKNFLEMINEIKRLLREQYASGKAVKSAQFKALQAQINPHFLYNTLDMINWEAVAYDAPEISEIAQNLAQFYRISLNKGKEIIEIKKELEHVQAYVAIENHHYENAVTLIINIPMEVEKYTCINLILQPFVENSIMHGMKKNSVDTECEIIITAAKINNNILFIIEDDGVGMTDKQIDDIFIENSGKFSHGYGVKNINSRLKLCYGEEYGIEYEYGRDVGAKVKIVIPALMPDETDTLFR